MKWEGFGNRYKISSILKAYRVTTRARLTFVSFTVQKIIPTTATLIPSIQMEATFNTTTIVFITYEGTRIHTPWNCFS